jgi:Cupredoxin-like domain
MLSLSLVTFVPAASADDATLVLELKDHKFQPLNPTIPANTRVKVTVKNLDPTPAEFESQDFDAEKVVPGNGQITVNIGPLDPGSYDFYDEYHQQESTTQLTVQ